VSDSSITEGMDYLLFDGDCGICSWSSEVARRIDSSRRFSIEPYQSFAESEFQPFGINYEKCAKKLQVITQNGRVYSGAFGVNYFLWKHFPWTLLVILVYTLPILLLLEVIGYRLVANNRHRISQWFGMKSCLLKS